MANLLVIDTKTILTNSGNLGYTHRVVDTKTKITTFHETFQDTPTKDEAEQLRKDPKAFMKLITAPELESVCPACGHGGNNVSAHTV